MSNNVIFAVLLMTVLFVDVRCQFYDFFEGLQPRQTNRHAQKRANATRRISNQRLKQTSDTTRKYDVDVPFFVFGDGFDRDNRPRAKPTRKSIYDVNATTRASVKKSTKNSSHRASSNNSKNERIVSNNDNVYGEYDNYGRGVTQAYIDGSINFIEYTTRKTTTHPTTNRNIQSNKYDSSSSHSDNYKQNYHGSGNNGENTNYYWSTQNPFKSAGRTASVENLPPITNRPATRRPSFNNRGVDETEAEPEVKIGVDVDDTMSYVEKKRYIEMAEKMCDKYKSLSTKQLQAIPLVPSPQPVKINVSSCAPTTIPLIVGGKVVSIEEFPHMAMLGWTKLKGDGYSWKCGGSLVSNQHIITAAHCTYYERDNTVVAGSPRVVQLGASYRDDPNALVVKISSITKHPRYKSPISYYDLAIIKLVTTVRFSDVIKPACLGVPPPIGKSIIATGWGQTQYGGEQSKELRSVSLPLWNMDECRNVLGVSRRIPDGPSRDSQICAGERSGGKDTCQGDSGGPAQIQDGCIWRVVGVTSLGRACGSAYTPGIYSIVNRAFIAAEIFGSNVRNNNNNRNENDNNSYDNYGDRVSKRRDSYEDIEKRNNNHKTTESNYNQDYNYNSRRSDGNNKNYKNSDTNDYNNRQSSTNYDINYNNRRQNSNNNRRTVTERNNNYDSVNSNYDRATENNYNQGSSYNSQRSDVGNNNYKNTERHDYNNQYGSGNSNYDRNYNDQRKNENHRTVTERDDSYGSINNNYNVNSNYDSNGYYNNRQNNYHNRQQQNSYNSNNNNGRYNNDGIYWTR